MALKFANQLRGGICDPRNEQGEMDLIRVICMFSLSFASRAHYAERRYRPKDGCRNDASKSVIFCCSGKDTALKLINHRHSQEPKPHYVEWRLPREVRPRFGQNPGRKMGYACGIQELLWGGCCDIGNGQRRKTFITQNGDCRRTGLCEIELWRLWSKC